MAQSLCRHVLWLCNGGTNTKQVGDGLCHHCTGISQPCFAFVPEFHRRFSWRMMIVPQGEFLVPHIFFSFAEAAKTDGKQAADSPSNGKSVRGDAPFLNLYIYLP
jgi:hypothetical protein